VRVERSRGGKAAFSQSNPGRAIVGGSVSEDLPDVNKLLWLWFGTLTIVGSYFGLTLRGSAMLAPA
jgi:hypothetical protein